MDIINSKANILTKDTRVIFAYPYCSIVFKKHGMDIDNAVYAAEQANPYQLSADLKINDLALNSSHDQRH